MLNSGYVETVWIEHEALILVYTLGNIQVLKGNLCEFVRLCCSEQR